MRKRSVSPHYSFSPLSLHLSRCVITLKKPARYCYLFFSILPSTQFWAEAKNLEETKKQPWNILLQSSSVCSWGSCLTLHAGGGEWREGEGGEVDKGTLRTPNPWLRNSAIMKDPLVMGGGQAGSPEGASFQVIAYSQG